MTTLLHTGRPRAVAISLVVLFADAGLFLGKSVFKCEGILTEWK